MLISGPYSGAPSNLVLTSHKRDLSLTCTGAGGTARRRIHTDSSYPARFDIEYPERVERWRVLQPLLLIPYAFVALFVWILAEIFEG